MHRWVGGWMHACVDSLMDTYTHAQMHGQMNAQTKEQRFVCKDRCTDGGMTIGMKTFSQENLVPVPTHVRSHSTFLGLLVIYKIKLLILADIRKFLF
jgi:hypothetical protein